MRSATEMKWRGSVAWLTSKCTRVIQHIVRTQGTCAISILEHSQYPQTERG
jgi:hypothetical protein